MREVFVEARSVEAGDLVVLSAVVGDDFAAAITVCGEVGRPCSNIGGVEGFGNGGIMDGEGGSVPCWITVDDVSEPVLVGFWHEQRNGLGLNSDYLGVAERHSSVELLHSHDFTTRLHCRVDQFAIFSIQWTEDVSDHLNLNRRQAVCNRAIGALQCFGAKMTQVRILDDTVDDSVQPIALRQHLVMDQSGPSRRGDEVW